MTAIFIELTDDEFDHQYPLVPNHINPSASWAFGDADGCLFETYGEEFEFVRRAYAYDKERDLNARVVQKGETAHWVHEKVEYDAGYAAC